MTDEGCTVNLDELTRPFKKESIRHRDGGGGKQLAYLDGATVIRRLNEATGNNWTFVVVSESERVRSTPKGDVLLLIAHGQMTIPGLGTREAVGVQEVQDRSGVDFYKGHYTDAMKKCASLFGVGLELYGEDHEYGDEPDPQPEPARTPEQQARVEQRHVYNEILEAAGFKGVGINDGMGFDQMCAAITAAGGTAPEKKVGDPLTSYQRILTCIKNLPENVTPMPRRAARALLAPAPGSEE